MNANQINRALINQEILDELAESLTPNQIKNMAINALAGKSQNNLVKYVKNEFHNAAAAMTEEDRLVLVAKTYFNYI